MSESHWLIKATLQRIARQARGPAVPLAQGLVDQIPHFITLGMPIQNAIRESLLIAIHSAQTRAKHCVGSERHALDDFIELVYATQDAKKVTKLKPAIDYINANYNHSISLADIAKASHLSVSRLAHIFKEQMKVTIIEYLTSVRIEHAKKLLLATDKNCTEICYKVGYNNQSYFTRTFRNLVGMTPRQFRAGNRRSGPKVQKNRFRLPA